MIEDIYLILGSNKGHREDYLDQARKKIVAKAGPIRVFSSIYETSAWGNTDQPDFLNQVIMINTSYTPFELLNIILSIEKSLGRERLDKWGQRVIDVDLLYIGQRVITTIELQVPHPLLQERKFVLVPLSEVGPDFIHPLLHKTNLELLKACPDRLTVRPFTSSKLQQ